MIGHARRLILAIAGLLAAATLLLDALKGTAAVLIAARFGPAAAGAAGLGGWGDWARADARDSTRASTSAPAPIDGWREADLAVRSDLRIIIQVYKRMAAGGKVSSLIRKPLMPHKRHNPQWICAEADWGAPLALRDAQPMA